MTIVVVGVGATTIASTPPTVAQVVSNLCLRAGLLAEQFDVTGLESIARLVRGLGIAQVGATRPALELLMGAYFFELVASDKIYFRVRGGAAVASIPYLALGASQGSAASEPLGLKQANELEIPAQIAITYPNVDDDYQPDTQYSDRLISAAAGTVLTVDMAIAMTASEAKAVADTMLLDQAASVISTSLALLGDYCRLEPTDPVIVTGADGSTYRLRLVKKTDSFPLIKFDAVIDDVSVLSSQGITSADYSSTTEVARRVKTIMELLDIPMLSDLHNDPGFYVATKGDGKPYAGSAVFTSSDDVVYTGVADVLESAVIGVCLSGLGDWAGPRVIDEMNAFTVDVGAGVLESSTRDVVLNNAGVNLILVGDEVLQFIRAELVDDGIYVLSRLLRGGRGTEWAMTGHASEGSPPVGERVVLLRSKGMRRVVMQNDALGIPKYYKGVTRGRPASTAMGVLFTDSGIGLKPFCPVDLRIARDGSNNITFTWQRRTRLATRMLGTLGISVPLGEGTEAYEVEILFGAPDRWNRVIRTTGTSAEYSAADQIADGLTPGNAITWDVRQMSAEIGRGYSMEKIG